MHRFDYYEPKTVEEACRLLVEFGDDASIFAGGTDLIPKMKNGLTKPKYVVNIKKIPDLDFVKGEGETVLSMGALTLLSELATHPLLLERFPVIATAARSIGSLQVRNLATLGGNLCNAAPSADMVPGLLVMDALVKVTGPSGDREMPLEEFFIEPGRVNLKRGELLAEVHVPFPPANTKQLYLKHSVRRAMDIAIVGVAVSLSFEKETGVCRKARIALGAVAPTPVRAKRAEEIILGKRLGGIPLTMVGDMVSREVAPITDVRGSAGYRSDMVSKLTIRAIQSLENL
jgi:CO/xanthine dehydrogenase FAD-binding subunit